MGEVPPSAGVGPRGCGMGNVPPSAGAMPHGCGMGEVPPSPGAMPHGCGIGEVPPSAGVGPHGCCMGEVPPSAGAMPHGCGIGEVPPGAGARPSKSNKCHMGEVPPSAGARPHGCGMGEVPPSAGVGPHWCGMGDGAMPHGCGMGEVPPSTGAMPHGCGMGEVPPSAGAMPHGCGIGEDAGQNPTHQRHESEVPQSAGAKTHGCGMGEGPPSAGAMPTQEYAEFWRSFQRMQPQSLFAEYTDPGTGKAWWFRDFLNRLMCTIAAVLFFLFPFLGTGDHHYKEDAFNQDAKANYVDKDTLYNTTVASLIYHWCNRSGQQELGQKFACKNVMFMNKVAQGRILVNASGIDHVSAESVVFQDGTKAPKCDCLVLCTGYRDVFPFLKGTIGDTGVPLSVPENNVRRLFKHVFHPQIGKSMAWIGFARPSTGGIPACAEMAARYFALLVANQRDLPHDMAQRTAREGRLDERYYCLSPDVKTLVGYKDWMDSMAELIGCEVQLWRYVFQPKLFVRLCIGSLLPCQYRLRGPGRLPEAMTTVLSLPVAATPQQSIVEVSYNVGHPKAS
eukprot:s4102_g5.t2